MNKIDFVLPWVDSEDKKWQQTKKQYSKNVQKGSDAAHRFRDLETLRYVLRSIEQNCPWYNKIYLITQGHFPKWLNIDHEKIVLISHIELYLDPSHLPTFNSSSIEMNLVHIKDLSQQFVYLNDDLIILNKIAQERFFMENLPVDFLVHGWIPRNKLFMKFRKITTWIESINNNIELINSVCDVRSLQKHYLYHKSYSFKDKCSNFLMKNVYKKVIWLQHWHHPQPFLKQTLQEVYNIFSKEMMECSKNRFRSNNDLTQYIYRYWQLLHGNFYPYKHNDGVVFNINSKKTLQDGLAFLKQNKQINFVCFNDSIDLSDEEFIEVKKELLNFLDKLFPKKASFEL